VNLAEAADFLLFEDFAAFVLGEFHRVNGGGN
jgi:hypothetical protein